MSSYPTPSDYQAALQTPGVAFTDPELQEATPRTNALGLPQPITGAFAAVFPLTTSPGGQYAAKCFVTEVPEQQARYEAVSEALEGLDHEALVPFAYQPHGVRVHGEVYPLLKMQWATGTTLNRFVATHLDQPAVMDRLAAAWAELMSDLEGLALAHGDLQHGNVLVDVEGDALRLRLVDYDTMYVPALQGRRSLEVGHRNYQHPDRTDADFGPSLDRFAGGVIYTALRACAVRPELWARFDTGENLLFRDADFYAPDESPLFEALANTEAVRSLAEALRTACYLEPTDMPPLPVVREKGVSVSLGDARRERSASMAAPAPRTGVARMALPVTASVVASGAALAAAGWVGAAAALLLSAGGAGAALVAARYRRLSGVRRRRRLEQEAARFDSALHELEREAESLREKRAELRSSKEERREQWLQDVQREALRDCLKHHFIGEVREVEGLTHKHVVRLKSAGIRTAAELTPDALRTIRRLSDRARVRLTLWRHALETYYAEQVPDALSPAQERRLRRYVQHRIEDIDEQLARTQEKMKAQQTERQRITDRLDDLPALTVGRYLRYLLRLGALPGGAEEPPAPSAPREANAASSPLPPPPEEEASWWKREA